jgi:hypothetical protein
MQVNRRSRRAKTDRMLAAAESSSKTNGLKMDIG